MALLIVDINDNWDECDAIFSALKLRVPAVLVLNKVDRTNKERIAEAEAYFSTKPYVKKNGGYIGVNGY
ncbi:hypothetical protein LWM68_29610 [Niabella sp. W65]|nr:hypothetical protein [Niabella sp. W65]MCH7366559.1 hypothetical protein [Niabella sp. W65]ULT42264.1 hypothetical protein KRR40_01050 [Niabella sp. I65]